MKSKFQRFSGTYICGLCGKKTRDTGRGEAAVELCAACLYDSYAENAAADYGVGSKQHHAAMEAANDLRLEQK